MLDARLADAIRLAKQARDDVTAVQLESLRLRAEAAATCGAAQRLRNQVSAATAARTDRTADPTAS